MIGEQLLRRISDSTALRYITVLWQLFVTIKDLDFDVACISQMQLVDSIHVLQRSRSQHASVHSINRLNALRWFASTVQPEGFPSLYQGLFHGNSWQSPTMRREAIPLPLAFMFWLETPLSVGNCSDAEGAFAGSTCCAFGPASDSLMLNTPDWRRCSLISIAFGRYHIGPNQESSCLSDSGKRN